MRESLSSEQSAEHPIYITTCGRGGTADALASGASGGNLVVVQIHSTAPSISRDKQRAKFSGARATRKLVRMA